MKFVSIVSGDRSEKTHMTDMPCKIHKQIKIWRKIQSEVSPVILGTVG